MSTTPALSSTASSSTNTTEISVEPTNSSTRLREPIRHPRQIAPTTTTTRNRQLACLGKRDVVVGNHLDPVHVCLKKLVFGCSGRRRDIQLWVDILSTVVTMSRVSVVVATLFYIQRKYQHIAIHHPGPMFHSSLKKIKKSKSDILGFGSRLNQTQKSCHDNQRSESPQTLVNHRDRQD